MIALQANTPNMRENMTNYINKNDPDDRDKFFLGSNPTGRQRLHSICEKRTGLFNSCLKQSTKAYFVRNHSACLNFALYGR